MCLINTPVIVNETEVRELKSKGAWQEQSSALARHTVFSHIKPQPHGPHGHVPSGQQTELVHLSAQQAHAVSQRGLGKKCKIMQGICLQKLLTVRECSTTGKKSGG